MKTKEELDLIREAQAEMIASLAKKKRLYGAVDDMLEALRQSWACIEHLSQYAPATMKDDVKDTMRDIESAIVKATVGDE